MVNKKNAPVVIEPGDAVISYSQFSMYQTCPHSWELAYIKGLRTKEPNIHLMFGTAMHETIQEWLAATYSGEPYKFDISDRLHLKMIGTFSNLITEYGEPFSSPDEMFEYYEDGVQILKQFLDAGMYDPSDTSLFGIETEIIVTPVESKPKVKLIGYLDYVLSMLNDTQFVITDLKTSNKGWSDYQKKDRTKLSQLMIYKHYFAKIHKIKPSNVTAQYIILSRKSSNKIEVFIPKQTPQFIKSVISELEDFVNYSFNDDGSYRVDAGYPAVSGYGYEKCRFCEFKDREDLCPVKSRIPHIEVLGK